MTNFGRPRQSGNMFSYLIGIAFILFVETRVAQARGITTRGQLHLTNRRASAFTGLDERSEVSQKLPKLAL